MKESVRSKNVFEYLQEQGSLTIGEFNVMAEGYPSDFSFVPYGFVPEVSPGLFLLCPHPTCNVNIKLEVYSDRVVVDKYILPYSKYVTQADSNKGYDVERLYIPGLEKPIITSESQTYPQIKNQKDGLKSKWVYSTICDDILFKRNNSTEVVTSISKYFTVLCQCYNNSNGQFDYKILFPEDLYVIDKYQELLF